MLESGDGIRVGTTWKTRIAFATVPPVPGDVTVQGKVDDGTPFDCICEQITSSVFQITVDGADITEGEHLKLEVYLGDNDVNAPTRPLVFPLRDEFGFHAL